jgi:hypothetical protein
MAQDPEVAESGPRNEAKQDGNIEWRDGEAGKPTNDERGCFNREAQADENRCVCEGEDAGCEGNTSKGAGVSGSTGIRKEEEAKRHEPQSRHG